MGMVVPPVIQSLATTKEALQYSKATAVENLTNSWSVMHLSTSAAKAEPQTQAPAELLRAVSLLLNSLLPGTTAQMHAHHQLV
jgi:hypothetical protein